ncbi:hypothetical protein [Synechococcus elongatus]|uniref:Uncharacterized protein n=1 Tax=Synechococcus elongatus PCC 11802 TaxID=2283154 RepID=A0AAT9JYH6_SYNEL|nr:hypothetical protein [Synechococcus elongatus]QFZ91446.1 hypothetical protein EKO22_02735 [Synechococcus elongatus PCC 11802]
MKRTPQTELPDWEAIADLDAIVVDKRARKRATAAKGRRRDRRYGKRLLMHQIDAIEGDVDPDDDQFIE